MNGGRTLTVLVADLSESTRLATSLGPERFDEVRRSVFARFDAAAISHSGTVVKTMGDGCLITYQSASDGVAAGVELVEAINRLARQVSGLRLRVGIAVGDLTEEAGDVFGEAVVLARRLCDVATPGQVLATDMVRALSGGRGGFDWERIGNMFLKGIDEPVPCSAARESLDVEARHRLPRALRMRPGEYFVGRSAALETLVRAWKETETGDRRIVLVSGEPGVGKTRLVAAAARRADEDGALVLFGRCEEHLAVPYQPFVDALRPAIDAAPREVLTAHVASHGGEIRRLFPSIPGPDPIDAAPELEQARLTSALVDLLGRLATEDAVVLVIDDLHWAAPATVQALRQLVTSEENASLLVLATYRDTDVTAGHPIAALVAEVARAEHAAQRIVLEGLGKREVEELIEAASGDALTLEGQRLAQALHDRTGGNPFFMNQVLRHLAESGELAFRDGHWDGPDELTELPGGVIDVVDQRLARLTPNAIELLEVAAVAGERFTHALIGRAARVESIDGAINGALGARILVDDGHGGYRFAHAILRDSVLARQTAAQRAGHHRDIAATLRTLHGDGLSAPLHDLAYHLCGAAPLGFTADAARFSIAAANKAMHAADVHAALEVLNRCWHTIEAVDPTDHEARFDVCARLAEIHYGSMSGEVGALEAAAESARVLQSAERLVKLSLVAYRWDLGFDDPFAMNLVNDALAMLPDQASPTRAMALASGAQLLNMGIDASPGEWTAQAFAMIDELGGPKASPELRSAWEYAVMSTAGQPRVREVLDRVEAVDGSPHSPSNNYVHGGYLGTLSENYLRAGDRAAALAILNRMDTLVTTSGDPSLLGWMMVERGIWALLEARYDDANANMLEIVSHAGVRVPNMATAIAVSQMWIAYEQGRSAEIVDGLRMVADASPAAGGIRAALGVHLCEAGRFDEARVELDALMEQMPTFPHSVGYGSVITLLAATAAQTGAVEYGEALLEALQPFRGEIIGVVGSVMQGATDRFVGMLLALLGRKDEALVVMRQALELETRMGAVAWIPRTEYWLHQIEENRLTS